MAAEGREMAPVRPVSKRQCLRVIEALTAAASTIKERKVCAVTPQNTAAACQPSQAGRQQMQEYSEVVTGAPRRGRQTHRQVINGVANAQTARCRNANRVKP